MTSIETERLTLRSFVHADAERVLDIHSRIEVVRWLSDPPFVLMADLDEARTWIDNWNTGDVGPASCGLAIEVRDTGVPSATSGRSAGTCTLTRSATDMSPRQPRC